MAEKVVQQRGLPDPRLAADDDRPAGAGSRLRDQSI
jgi:hypothetical protein